MKIRDRFGSVINIYQARNGKICILWGDGCIKLSKRDCQLFPLYDIEDFDVDLYNQAYEDAPQEIAVEKPARSTNTKSDEVCVWHHDDGAWSTDCGQLFVLNDGRPYQNGMRFCYHCGRKLRAARKTKKER